MNFKITVLRYSNVYGPRQDPHGEAGICAIFSSRMLEGKSVTIFGDGTQIRDYVYVEDVAAANLLAIEKGDGQAYNIATGIGTSTQQVFETLKEATNYTRQALQGAERLGEVQKIVLLPEKAERELGWKAQVEFKEGVEKTINWYRTPLN